MPREVSSRTFLIAQILAWSAGLAICLPVEIARFRTTIESGAGAFGWFLDMNVDTTPFLILLILAPIAWFMPKLRLRGSGGISRAVSRWFGSHTRPASGAVARGDMRRAWTLAAIVFAAAICASLWIASRPVGPQHAYRFGDLPPAYHDEYSYLFQARTYLAGRLSFPSHSDVPALFDQMHVVNEGRFASRYFPGAGAWIAPFLAARSPYWGHFIAGAIAAMLLFWTGRELGGNGVGFLAGMLTALSPGIALFSNLLLAHHPTLVGLALFLWAFLRTLRTRSARDALIAGVGLAFAMLCRPMTAAGFALPFGVWLGISLLRGRGEWSSRASVVAAMGAPLLAGLAILFVANRAVTGSGWTSPYQLYTDTYTPRHGYGFNNRTRGEQHLGPKVIANYDEWAENLTPSLAMENVSKRTVASLQWTLAIVPLVVGGVLFVFLVPWSDAHWWFIPLGILSLHAVHVPYWFVGIMNWHYVFESAILLLLMFAGASVAAIERWAARERNAMPLWWMLLIAVALATAYIPLRPFWTVSRLENGIGEVAFSRLKYPRFNEAVAQLVQERPALVLIEHDPADRHIDFVSNDPALQSNVLLGRWRPESVPLERIRQAFPDRAIYLYRVKNDEWVRLAAASPSS